MGCFFSSKTKADALSKIIEEKYAKVVELESTLSSYDGQIKESEYCSNISKLNEEYVKSLKNFYELMLMFPKLTFNPQQQEVQLDFAAFSIRNYMYNRLKITDLLKHAMKAMENVVKKLKDINLNKSNTINSTIESLERLINQAQFEGISKELEDIKNLQIELSSYRGGTLEELLKRIEEQCYLSKQLETIQSKIESAQYCQNLDNIVADSDEITEQIATLMDKKDSIERICDTMSSGFQEKLKIQLEPLYVKVKGLEDALDKIINSIAEIQNFQAKQEENKEQIAQAKQEIKILDENLAALKQKVAELCKEKDLYSQLSRMANKIKSKIEMRSQSILNLNDEFTSLAEESRSNFLEIADIPEHEEELAHLEENLSEVVSVEQNVSDNIQENIRKGKEKIKMQISLRLIQGLQTAVSNWFWKWKQASQAKLSDSYLQKSFNLNMLDEEDLREAELFIDEQRKMALRSENILLKFMENNDRIMDKVKLFKFLEELLDKKYEVDTKDLKDGVLPMQIPEFMYNFITGIFGILKSAERHIGQMIFSLKALRDSGHPYATFFCDLLHIFTSEPISYEFSIYLVRVRYDFQSLIYKYEKQVMSHGKKLFHATSNNKLTEYFERGGFASLSDVIDLVTSIFEHDRNAGMIALQKIKPDNVTTDEFVTFQISQKVARMEKSIESIFNMVDKDSSNSIDRRELIVFTRTSMDLWISESDLDSCFSKLVGQGTGVISRESFIKIFSPNFFQEVSMTEKFLIDKSKFLNIIVEMYNVDYKKRIGALISLLGMYPSTIGKQDFVEILTAYDQSSDGRTKNIDFFRLAKENGRVDQKDMIYTMLKYGLGDIGRSPFAIHELFSDLDQRDSIKIQKSLITYSNSDAMSPRLSLKFT